jgi:hypothetical protein
MARALSGKTNVIAPGGSYPYGRVRNNSGIGDGTNVNENLLGDLIQFFEKLLADGGVTANGQPENSSDGFQYSQALNAIIAALVAAEAAIRAAADTANSNAITAETAARIAADTANSNAITAETAARIAADNLKADLASPALTGNPTAPTQAPGTNNTRISTTAYADAAVAVEAGARSSDVSAEAGARAAADTALDNAKANRAQSAWTNLTLINGWANFTGTAKYRVDEFGKVHISANLSATSASSDVFANIPGGITPSIDDLVMCITAFNGSAQVPAILVVSSSGNLQVNAQNTSYRYKIQGISYWTDES